MCKVHSSRFVRVRTAQLSELNNCTSSHPFAEVSLNFIGDPTDPAFRAATVLHFAGPWKKYVGEVARLPGRGVYVKIK